MDPFWLVLSIIFSPLTWIVVAVIIVVIYRNRGGRRSGVQPTVGSPVAPVSGQYVQPNTQGQFGEQLPFQDVLAAEVRARDALWRKYIAGFRNAHANAAETALIERILGGKHAPDVVMVPAGAAAAPQVFGVPAGLEGPAAMQPNYVAAAPSLAATPGAPAQSMSMPRAQHDVDGTSLLLYFGAFLFVAAAGLFVAFGGFSGGVRTLTVLATIAVLYFGGLWLYQRSRKLRPAGVAFTAIGMAIAPLAGVAAYYFLAGGAHASFIWLLTSLLCFGLYINALRRLHYTFITYLFIFSFISLFESAVSIVHAPVYYYIWGLIVAGMVLRFIGAVKAVEDMAEPAHVSAQVIMPLSLLVSAAITPRSGFGQLSVTLLLAASYYLLELREGQRGKAWLAAGSQILYVAGIATGVYAMHRSLAWVAGALLALAAVQGAAVMLMPRTGELAENFASVAFATALAAAGFAAPNGIFIAASMGVGVLLGAVTAVRQRRADAYVGAAVLLAVLPYIVGQVALRPAAGASLQSGLAFVPVLVLWLFWRWLAVRRMGAQWLDPAAAVYVLAGLAALGTGLIAGRWVAVAAAAAFALTLALAARWGVGKGWWSAAGFVIALAPLLEANKTETAYFAVSLLLALVMNIGITLLSREEWNRWLVTVLGLALPVAAGAGGFGWHFNTAMYAYAYLVVFAGLTFCRAVARGVYFASSKIPLVSYYRSASLSYVVGYIVAAGTAVLTSLGSAQSHLHTSIILAVLIAAAWYIALYVEKRRGLLALLPWLVVALLTSVVRPPASETAATLTVLAVSFLAIGAYALFEGAGEYFGEDLEQVLQAMLLLVFFPVVLCAWYATNKYVPAFALAIAGVQLLYYARTKRQGDKEASGAVIVGALMWALYIGGLHNLQVYTHIAAATFALYAYWRYLRGDRENSDNYLKVMLGTATIPLAMQALGGQAGDVYGWWLLLEQICFMLIGISIGRRFVTMWGLYVALGAVLYQLRNLGWAALTLLALFVIGMAVYRLQRQTSDHTDHHDQPQ